MDYSLDSLLDFRTFENHLIFGDINCTISTNCLRGLRNKSCVLINKVFFSIAVIRDSEFDIILF